MPIDMSPITENIPGADTFDAYVKNILMNMGTEAQGFLLYVVPVALRIKVFNVTLDTSKRAKRLPAEYKKFNINEYESKYHDIGLTITDNLNFHKETLYVLRTGDHFDILYHTNSTQEFNNLNALCQVEQSLSIVNQEEVK
jgi:hypothetical protein